LHPRKLSLFALLSVADLTMTWHLVQASGGHIYESNPIAGAWLASFGWLGLVAYKALAMAMVAGAAVFIARYRPRLAGGVLVFACAMTAAVVVYSGYLSFFRGAQDLVHAEDALVAQQRSELLDREMGRQQTYRTLLASLSRRLAQQEFSLTEAVTRLEETEKARSPQWLDVLKRNYPGRSAPECLAIHIGYHALNHAARRAPDKLDQLASRLETDYLETFGSEFHFDLAHLGYAHAPPSGDGPARYSTAGATGSLSFAVTP
jgi:uncharacterized protein DUF5658